MKLLFDFLPIVLFFGTFKYAEGHKDWAAALASESLGFMVAGGAVGPNEAPVLLATVVVILATLGQVGYLMAKRQKIDMMLWISLVLVVGLGGATIWFHSDTFIKWKPSVLYWAMGLGLMISAWVFNKNLLKRLLGEQLKLPEPIWGRLNAAWVVFFTGMGCLNLFVAYAYPTDIWVNFKLFGGMGLMLAFALVQGIYVSRHVIEDAAPETNATPPPKG